MSEPGSSWLTALGATVSSYAAAALESGEETAAGLYAQLAGAHARVQALPAEATEAVDDLTAAVAALFGDGAHPVPPIAVEVSPATTGRDGGIGEAARRDGLGHVVPRVVPRRTRIDAAAFARFIRAQHPTKPAEHAAALTGIPIDSIEKMLARESLPNGPNFLLCVIAYGPALIAAVLPEADERWLIGAQILADQARLADELSRTKAAIAANAGRWSFCGIEFGITA